MNSVVGPEALFIAGAWWVVAAVIIVIGWRRRNRVLLIVGALVGAGALLTAVQLWFLLVSLYAWFVKGITKPRAQSPEPRAQSPEPRAQSPEPKAQSPKPIPPPSVFPSPCTSPAHGSSARTRRDASGRVRTRGRNVAHRLRRRTGTPTAARASAGFRAWSG